jgi:hypothetical protein
MKPLNHRRFKLILLLAFWVGMELSMTLHAHSEVTKQTEKPTVKYHWKVLDYVEQLLKWRQMLYEPKKKKAQHPLPQIPNAEPASRPTEVERWNRGAREHSLASSTKTRGIPLLVRGQNPGRSNRTSLTSPPSQRTLHRSTYRPVSLRGQP